MTISRRDNFDGEVSSKRNAKVLAHVEFTAPRVLKQRKVLFGRVEKSLVWQGREKSCLAG